TAVGACADDAGGEGSIAESQQGWAGWAPCQTPYSTCITGIDAFYAPLGFAITAASGPWVDFCLEGHPEPTTCETLIGLLQRNLELALFHLQNAERRIKHLQEEIIVPVIQQANGVGLGMGQQAAPGVFAVDMIGEFFRVRQELIEIQQVNLYNVFS